MPEIQLLPNGPKGKPVFKTRADYEAWRISFYEEIKPKIEALEHARRESIKESMFRYVG